MVNVIAHRGSGVGPTENTLHGLRMAVEWGVNGVEVDVRSSRDGALVLMHDETLDRTTNGRGRVGDQLLAQLKRLDAGAGEQIPTLKEVLNLLKLEKKVVLHMEIKTMNIEAQALQLILEADMHERVVISSFLPSVLKKVNVLDEKITTAYLYHYDKSAIESAQELGCSGLHPLFASVTQTLVQVAQQEGLFVNPWTVDFKEEMQRLIGFGVDGIITNNPPLLIDLIRSEESYSDA